MTALQKALRKALEDAVAAMHLSPSERYTVPVGVIHRLDEAKQNAIDALARHAAWNRRADASTIAQVKETAIPLTPAGDKEREEWVNAKDRLPDCDEDAIYIGINDAGFVGAFTSITQTPSKINNGYMYINCYYDTAEENVHVMNGLKLWRKMDLPRGIELGWKEGGGA